MSASSRGSMDFRSRTGCGELVALRSHWGCGIGRQLAAAVDTWAREQNLRRIAGLVLAHNPRALRFANAAGFREELVSPRYAVIDWHAIDRARVVKTFTSAEDRQGGADRN